MCWLPEEWRCAGSLKNEDVLALWRMKICWLPEEWRCAGSLKDEDVLALWRMKMCWLTEEWRCAGSLNNEDVLAYCNAVSNYTDMATHWVIGDPYWFTGDVVNHWRCRESLDMSWITGDVVTHLLQIPDPAVGESLLAIAAARHKAFAKWNSKSWTHWKRRT